MSYTIPLNSGFLGSIPWANFDGVHYLRIADSGYFGYGEAFFPLYPLLIRWVTGLTHLPLEMIAMGISVFGFIVGLSAMYQLFEKLTSKKIATWAVVFMIVFPTSFFFTATYSEGIFFALSSLCLLFLHKKNYYAAGLCAGLASGTRIVGIFLLAPFFIMWLEEKTRDKKKIIAGAVIATLGLLSYMYYQYTRLGDPFIFIHVQPAFGTGRNVETLVLLPQVFYRYTKMLLFAVGQPTWASYFTTVLELVTTIVAGWGIYRLFKVKNLRIYAWYSGIILMIPTLTGTFTSLPRYVLGAFPLLLPLAGIKSDTVKICLAVSFLIFQGILTIMFLRGRFIG